MLGSGLLLGALSRVFDIYTQNIGNIFSQMAVWILLGTVISIYSIDKKSAMINIFLFCLGMLVSYYAADIFTDGVYSTVMIGGWTLFALFSPVLAYLAWMTKEKGLFPKIIGIGIVSASVLSSVILFDGPRIYDAAIDGLLIYFIFFKRVKRRV